MNLFSASTQWATRPDDDRYTTLEDLREAVEARKDQSWTSVNSAKDLRMRVDDGLIVNAYDTTKGEIRALTPTHWAFSQLAGYAQAPAAYLRRLPSDLAAINLQWGLEHSPIRPDSLILGQSNGSDVLRSMTSTSYGRIWDREVVEAVQRANSDGRWKIPASSYSTQNPRRATTLYASDHDVFIFLVDPERPIEVGGETLFRGFLAWNSEVGASVFGLSTFLYRYVCDNRIIWGATQVNELRIRHTSGAPERFAYEGETYLQRYSNESTAQIENTVRRAQAYELRDAEKPGMGWDKWLQARGFAQGQAKSAIDSAIAEEGQARSLWDIVNGITASARTITRTDDRVKLETAAGRLLDTVNA
jgi:hypothetical protein